MPERWPQVCRVKVTFELLRAICFVSITTNSIEYVLNWIPLNTHVGFENTQPCLKGCPPRDAPSEWVQLWYKTFECGAGTADPTWGDIFECCFKAQSSKLKAQSLFCHVLVKRDGSSFELWALKRAFENVTSNGIGCRAYLGGAKHWWKCKTQLDQPRMILCGGSDSGE